MNENYKKALLAISTVVLFIGIVIFLYLIITAQLNKKDDTAPTAQSQEQIDSEPKTEQEILDSLAIPPSDTAVDQATLDSLSAPTQEGKTVESAPNSNDSESESVPNGEAPVAETFNQVFLESLANPIE